MACRASSFCSIRASFVAFASAAHDDQWCAPVYLGRRALSFFIAAAARPNAPCARDCVHDAGANQPPSSWHAEVDFLARVEAAERRDNMSTNPNIDPTPKYSSSATSAPGSSSSSSIGACAPSSSAPNAQQAVEAAPPGKASLKRPQRTSPMREHRVHDETGGAQQRIPRLLQPNGRQGAGQQRAAGGKGKLPGATPRAGGGAAAAPPARPLPLAKAGPHGPTASGLKDPTSARLPMSARLPPRMATTPSGATTATSVATAAPPAAADAMW